MTNLVFLDCETTGLDLELDPVWNVAAFFANQVGEELEILERREWFFDLSPEAEKRRAELPQHLQGAFTRSKQYERTGLESFAYEYMGSSNMHFGLSRQFIVGAVPSFDTAWVGPMLKTQGWEPPWHYRLICVRSMIYGHLALAPDSSPFEASKALGVDPDDFFLHSASGDCALMVAQYAEVYGLDIKG